MPLRRKVASFLVCVYSANFCWSLRGCNTVTLSPSAQFASTNHSSFRLLCRHGIHPRPSVRHFKIGEKAAVQYGLRHSVRGYKRPFWTRPREKEKGRHVCSSVRKDGDGDDTQGLRPLRQHVKRREREQDANR